MSTPTPAPAAPAGKKVAVLDGTNAMNAEFNALAETLKGRFADRYFHSHGNHVLWESPATLYSTLAWLRDEAHFNMLLDVCGVDNLQRPKQEWTHGKRFEAVYHLLNMETHQRVRVRVPLNDDLAVPSATG